MSRGGDGKATLFGRRRRVYRGRHRRTSYNNTSLTGSPSFTRSNVRIDFNFGTTATPGGSPPPARTTATAVPLATVATDTLFSQKKIELSLVQDWVCIQGASRRQFKDEGSVSAAVLQAGVLPPG